MVSSGLRPRHTYLGCRCRQTFIARCTKCLRHNRYCLVAVGADNPVLYGVQNVKAIAGIASLQSMQTMRYCMGYKIV